jgi:hypothetical protein
MIIICVFNKLFVYYERNEVKDFGPDAGLSDKNYYLIILECCMQW